jgi:hypothetical protein
MKHPLLFILPVALLSFAAGWWARPVQMQAGEKSIGELLTGNGAAAVPANPDAAKGAPEVVVNPRALPFHTWADVAAFIADGGIEDDPMLIQDGIARLSNTSDADLETILNQAAATESPDQQNSAREIALSVLLFRWSMRAPERAASFAMAHPDWEATTSMAGYLVGNLARDNPAMAKALLEKIPETDRHDAEAEFYYVVAAADPKAFLNDPERKGILEENSDLEKRIFNAWVKKSPSEAAAWFQSLPTEMQTEELGEGLMRTWMARDPKVAMDWLQALPNADARSSLCLSYGTNLVQNVKPENLAAALEKLPSTIADDVMRGVINDWPDTSDPQTKAFLFQWLDKHPEAPEGSHMADSLVRSQMEADPTANTAMAFIKELPLGSVKDRAISSMTEAWVQQDAETASKWVATLPEGNARDMAALQLAQGIQEDDPEGALIWSLSIKKSDEQQTALKDLFKYWLPHDPHAAMKALSGLPEEAQRQLGFQP